jgi:F-type H+-transporting ATPase subunit b
MSELVHQIGELFLRAVPVALIILLFYFIMRSLFFRPLLKAMAEREARTAGAQKAAAAAQSAAAQKIKQYEEALKQARAKVYLEQETQRKTLLDERANVLRDARTKATTEVNSAKGRIAGEFSAAKKDLEATTLQLATEIARRILPAAPAPGAPSREAQ